MSLGGNKCMIKIKLLWREIGSSHGAGSGSGHVAVSRPSHGPSIRDQGW